MAIDRVRLLAVDMHQVGPRTTLVREFDLIWTGRTAGSKSDTVEGTENVLPAVPRLGSSALARYLLCDILQVAKSRWRSSCVCSLGGWGIRALGEWDEIRSCTVQLRGRITLCFVQVVVLRDVSWVILPFIHITYTTTTTSSSFEFVPGTRETRDQLDVTGSND